ncbi:MAG: Rrf2 family transcriptional regulator [Deltaproteobacteria bacterium]|nr:Rrf2 family transcriptional regulator [Deltaproteobacteria bacterium]
MRLTRAAEYALRAARFLASRREEGWFSIQEIAADEDVPTQFLAKVMQRLTQAGLVQSACGKTGGYRLARPADEMTISDVVTAMEGPLSVNQCLLYPNECRFQKECKMHHVWQEMQDAMTAVMQKYSLADVTWDDR